MIVSNEKFLSHQLSMPIQVVKQYLGGSIKVRRSVYQFELGKNGKKRLITNPCDSLKAFLIKVNQFLSSYELPEYFQGGIKGRDILSNAKIHKDNSHMVSLDISNYFPSITKGMVKDLFLRLGFVPALANKMAKICTFEGSLPQGYPTSTTIANLFFYRKAKKKVERFLKDTDLTLSIWVDDIFISGKRPITNEEITRFVKIIEYVGLSINSDKTKRFFEDDRKKVAGVQITTKIGVPRNYLRDLDYEMYLFDKKKIPIDTNLFRSLKGKLMHVKRLDEKMYVKLITKYPQFE